MKNADRKETKDNSPSLLPDKINESLNNTHEGLAFVGKDLTLHSFNSLFKDIYSKFDDSPLRSKVFVPATPLFVTAAKGKAIIKQVLGGAKINMETRTPLSTAEAPFSLYLEPAFDEKQQVVGIFLKLSKKTTTTTGPQVYFKSLVESSGDAVVVMSPEGKPIYVSPSIEKVLGYTQEEAMNLDIYSAVHPDDLLENQRVMEKAIFNPNLPIQGHVSRILHKDGTYHWYDSIVVNLLNDPAVGGIVDNIREVTERVETEKANRHIEEMFGMVVDSNKIGVWELDLRSLSSTRNLRHDQIFGYASAVPEWTAATFFEHIHPDERAIIKTLFSESIEKKELDFETRIVWPDKSIHWVSVKGKVLSDGISEKIFGTVMDISELRKTKKALTQSESRLRGIVEHLSEGLIIADQEGNLLYWNPAALKMHGLQSKNEAMKTMTEFLKDFKIYEQDDILLPFKKWPLPRLLRNEPVEGLELQISSIRHHWKKVFRYNGGSFPDTEGNTVYFLAFSDVSDVSTSRKKVKQNEGHFWDAFHLSPIALAICRKADGTCLDLNKGAEELLGYTYDDYVGKTILALNHASVTAYAKFLEDFNHNEAPYSEHEIQIVTNEGERRILVFSVEQIRLEGEDCRLSILVDITERKSGTET